MITDEEFEKIKQDYNAGTLQIGIDLAVVKKDMNMTGNKTSVYWNISFTIMMLLSFFVGIYCIGGWGILYGIVFSILLFSYIGTCSINYKNKDLSLIINIIGLIVSFFFTWKIAILLIFVFFNFISVYLYYIYIKQESIRLILSHIELLEGYLKDGVITFKYKDES